MASQLLLMPGSGRAAAMRAARYPYEIEICDVGLDASVGPVEAERPEPVWCWAACVSAVLRMHGVALAQRRIVAETYGRIEAPAWGRDIADATTRRWLADDFRWFSCRCAVLWDGDLRVERAEIAAEAARTLGEGSPLIIGTGDHVMLLTQITYAHDAIGNGQPLAAVVRDPMPGKGRRPLKAHEWTGARFLAKLYVRGDDRAGW